MKNLLLTCAAILGLSSSLVAQNYNVTFQVDMRGLIVSPNGVHATGNFQMAAGFPGDWEPGTTALSDSDGDGIYTYVASLPNGSYQYKYVNGNAWGSDENPIPAACNVGGNRGFTVSGADLVIPVHAFGSCDPNPAGNPVIFRVDMKTQTVGANGVHVAGNFQAAAGFPGDWDPATTELTDPDGDMIYQTVVWLNATGTYEYKFVNGNAWGSDEGVPGACAVNGNRGLDVQNANGIVTPLICFASCDPCPSSAPDTLYLKFQVNMANQEYTFPPYNIQISDTVSVAGSFQSATVPAGAAWTPGAVVLEDADGDKIYDVVVRILEGTYQFKYLNGKAWGTDESVPGACAAGGNREFAVQGNNGDTVAVPLVCFGECNPTCPASLPPINVTFLLDLNNAPSANVGPFVAGSHQYPNKWQKTSDAMTETFTGSGIYKFTQAIRPAIYEYKYFYGTDTTAASGGMDNIAEFNDLTSSPGACAIINPFGDYNRILDLTGVTQDTVLPAYEFNSCSFTLINLSLEDYVNGNAAFSILPNPMTAQAEIRFSNADRRSFEMTVTNLAGQVVMRKSNITENYATISRQGLANGIYFVTLWNDKGERATRKMIVE